MFLMVKESSGDTLIGAINGINRMFTATMLFYPSTVSVYLNGQKKVADLDDGYRWINLNTVEMKIAPLVGDVLVIEYQINLPEVRGGALGGVPPSAETFELRPEITSIETTIIES